MYNQWPIIAMKKGILTKTLDKISPPPFIKSERVKALHENDDSCSGSGNEVETPYFKYTKGPDAGGQCSDY